MIVNQLNGDLFVPGEGYNSIFKEVLNCSIESSSYKKGFPGAKWMFRKRDGNYSPTGEFGRNLWEVKGNIIQGKKQGNEIIYYTDQGFVYRFDGTNNRVILTSPQIMSSSGTGSNFSVYDGSSVGQTFSPLSGCAISSISVRIRLKGTVPAEGIIKLKLSKGSSKDTTILISSTTYSASQLTSSYQSFSFDVFNYYVAAGDQHFFTIEADNVNSTNCFEVEYGSNLYSDGSMWTNAGSWVDTGTNDLNFSIVTSKALYYDSTRSPDILRVSYLGGGLFNGEMTVSTYTLSTKTIKFHSTLTAPTSGYVGKILYVSSGDGTRQRRYVTANPSSDELQVDLDFSAPISNGTKVVFYNRLISQMWFNQLRRGPSSPDNDYLYALDIEGNNMFWYYPIAKDMVFFDNRIVYSKRDGTGIIGTSNIDLEVPMPTTVVDFGNDQIISIFPYGGYLIVGFQNNTILIKKKITNETTGTFIYKDQGLTQEGLFSRDSYLSKGGALKIITGDLNAYDVDLSLISLDDVIGDLKPFGLELINYLKGISGGTIDMKYINSEMLIIHKKDGFVRIFKYNELYAGWIVDEYSSGQNFMNFIFSINGEEYYPVGNSIKRKGGITDSGSPIKQYIMMEGPVDRYLNLVSFSNIKMNISYDQYGIGGEVTISGGGNTLVKKSYKLNKLGIVQDINNILFPETSMGSSIFGEDLIGGPPDQGIDAVRKKFPDFINLSMNPGIMADTYKIEITNNEDRQLYFASIWCIYSEANVKTVKGNNIISGELL